MKFRFLNGMDCPDWLLGEIAEFSKLSVIKFKTFCTICSKSLTDHSSSLSDDILLKYTSDTIDSASVRRMFVAGRFLLEKAAKADCEPTELDRELQQLGLPSEHSKQISKHFTSCKDDLRAYYMKNIMKEPPIVIQSIQDNGKAIELALDTSNRDLNKLLISKQNFVALQSAVKEAEDLMNKLQGK